MTKTVILGVGLTNEMLSSEHRFSRYQGNLGQREIARLLGSGRSFGGGPLAVFLRRATEEGTPVVLLRPRQEVSNNDGSASRSGVVADLVDPVANISSRARVLETDGESVPADALLEAVAEVTEMDPAASSALAGSIRLLVVGCHTEGRVYSMASYFKRILGFKAVAVSAHLVGSSTQEAHLATLRHILPGIGVRVFLDLKEAADFAGIDTGSFETFAATPCAIEPAAARDDLADDQRAIIELLCMHWTKVYLRPLSGGFSGSLLLLADGWKGDARTEPMVLKLDGFRQMRRELEGYYQVKDFFGKNVPTLGYPVSRGDKLGVGMELAAMEGKPETLQETFERAEGEEALATFNRRLEKALALAGERLYRNTRETSWVVPYRVFGLHTEQMLVWLRENAALILQYHENTHASDANLDLQQLATMVRLIAGNEDGIESEVCLGHGDLNFANVICDEGNNIWFIDWTHCAPAPIETDFAKTENDAKFVMTKTFDVDDIPRLRKFEEYLLAQRIPADIDGLPDGLKFAKWDLRFRKILGTVRRIRQACFALKDTDSWLVYKIALLKYALHTLSFDKRRNRGECDLPQLMHALYSVEHLTFALVSDDFHLKIRGERPGEYPPRQRIPIDEASWLIPCPSYDPPYYVHPSVIANDRSAVSGAWADPEDPLAPIAEPDTAESKPNSRVRMSRVARRVDDEGRPLNPRGRTGIAGRGLLGLWGANLSAAAVCVRGPAPDGGFELLLGDWEDETELNLPKGFVLPEETPSDGLLRVLKTETGWQPSVAPLETVFDGHTYDPRQTDHAWVETRAFLLFDGDGRFPDAFDVSAEFDEIKWWPLDAETVNRVPSGQSVFVREALVKLVETNRMDQSTGEALLARTG